ncbi:Nudix family hydrolase [Motiliproteus coralliicola]|uniref:8-oxo-dGTP diphosphatase n=1 Tax=Motiliproteus coralliicola TaxID=2283196 RepID=A0A369WMS4_9GAMM|nr:Nudix family hydrolase [Motiliproteus coralliicola]RDE22801.1 Nudix family hydrolase [Motiliproteus coralliicola]
MTKVVHVAAAAIYLDDGRLLISRRPAHLHQGGLLEFPGGKLESDETPQQALIRELEEELGIIPKQFEPLIRIPYDYPDKRVLLDVWRVTAFDGKPEGREGQQLYRLDIDGLEPAAFPAANRPIIAALQLPQLYLITPELPTEILLQRLASALDTGVGLVQLRANHLDDGAYLELADQVLPVCHRRGARLLLNRHPSMLAEVEADGVHLNSRLLEELQATGLPVLQNKWFGASCHNAQQLRLAQQLGLDYALLSPVCATETHPDAQPLGWTAFESLVAPMQIPVYGLGGLSRGHLPQVLSHGGQGVAGIGAFIHRAV